MEFVYTAGNLQMIRTTVSDARLGPYLAKTGGNLERAVRLYERNTHLSEVFYRPLQGLEVALRNGLQTQLAQLSGVEAWYDDQKLPLNSFQKAKIDESKKSVSKQGKEASPGRIVAELSFGFWTSLLGPGQEHTLWIPALRHAFPHGRGLSRRKCHQEIDCSRRFRNRVAHHEPIWDRNPGLMTDYLRIIETIGLIDPVAADWVDATSQFRGVYASYHAAGEA